LAGLADAVLVVVSAVRDKAGVPRKGLGNLAIGGGKIEGVVLNNFDPHRVYGRFYGGYRYGHYATYGAYNSYKSVEKKGS